MAVRNIKNSWWVDLRANHTRYRKRSPENSRAGAQAYESVLRQKLARGEQMDNVQGTTQQALTFEQFAWKWYEDYVIPNNKYQEARMKKYILRAFLIPFFGKMSLEQITTQHVEQFKAQVLKVGTSPKTINNRLATFSKCMTTAYEWLKLSGTPPKVKWLKCPPPRTNYLSADECELVLAHAEGVVYEMILIALRTGMRQGEIRGLQWSSIDWENRSLAVRHSLNDRTKQLESPKSNRERHIPLDVDVYEALFKRKKSTGHVFLDTDGQPFDSQRLIRRLRDVRKKAGLRDFSWHSLRHTFASHLAMKGAPLHVVQALLGHSTIMMTMRYAHVAPSALRSAIAMLNPKTAVTTDFGQPVGNQWAEAIQQETRNA
jgi:integrase